MTDPGRRSRSEAGFSLAEILAAIAILALVVGTIVTVQLQGQQAYLLGAHRVEVQSNGRGALDLMIRELRSAQRLTVLGGATDLTFLDAAGVTIRYRLTATTLQRTVSGVASPLAGGVESFSMTYYSAYDPVSNTGTITTAPGEVAGISIQLTTRTEDTVAPGSPGDQRMRLISMVYLRNS